jgi:hypothetical protein
MKLINKCFQTLGWTLIGTISAIVSIMGFLCHALFDYPNAKKLWLDDISPGFSLMIKDIWR